MSLTRRKTARLWLRLMEISLLAYTGWRTVDLLGMTMPSGTIAAVLALIGIDFAFPAWRYYYNHGAANSMQRAIAFTMCMVTFSGILLILAGDTLWHYNNRAGLSESLFTQVAIWASIAVILSDLAALATLDISEPENQQALNASELEELTRQTVTVAHTEPKPLARSGEQRRNFILGNSPFSLNSQTQAAPSLTEPLNGNRPK